MIFALFFLKIFVAGNRALAFGEKVFGSGRRDIFKRMIFRLDLPADGIAEMEFFIVSLNDLVFCGKTVSWVKARDNFLL